MKGSKALVRWSSAVGSWRNWCEKHMHASLLESLQQEEEQLWATQKENVPLLKTLYCNTNRHNHCLGRNSKKEIPPKSANSPSSDKSKQRITFQWLATIQRLSPVKYFLIFGCSQYFLHSTLNQSSAGDSCSAFVEKELKTTTYFCIYLFLFNCVCFHTEIFFFYFSDAKVSSHIYFSPKKKKDECVFWHNCMACMAALLRQVHGIWMRITHWHAYSTKHSYTFLPV